MRRGVLDHMLPSFPDAGQEADRAQREAFESFQRECTDPDTDPSEFTDHALEIGLENFEGVEKMRQSALNASTIMLWHLIEQQLLEFHMRQVLDIGEEAMVRNDGKERNKLFRLEKMRTRMAKGGCAIESLPSWSKIDELRLVANSVKHGPGDSLDKLFELRPDLLTPPNLEDEPLFATNNPAYVSQPAGGEDIYVRETDVIQYFNAAESFWLEFGDAIEAHSSRG